MEPALAATVVNNPTSSTQLTLNADTRFILVTVSGSGGSYHMNRANNPTALATTASVGYIPVNGQMFLGVQSGGRDKVGARTPAKIAFINDG